MNATQKLVVMMIRHKEVAEYIEKGWNALYNDIIWNRSAWKEINFISEMAIHDIATNEQISHYMIDKEV